MDLTGKVALVTGGGQGIGAGIVRCLAEAGADAAIITRSGVTGDEVAKELVAMGREALAIKADVTDQEQVSAAVAATMERFGRIDALVNSVGGGSVDIAPFLELEGPEWELNFDLNVKSAVHTCRAVVPILLKQGSGRIVNVSSVAGKRAMASNAPYGTAKAGVIYFTKALAAELGSQHINVNCICPGGVFTPTFAGLIDKHMIRPDAKAKGMTARDFFDRFIVGGSPFNREITPEDIGKAAVFLASDHARNITGQTLNITAGTALDLD